MTYLSVTVTRYDDQLIGGTAEVWVITEQVGEEIRERLGRPDGELLMPRIGDSDPDAVVLMNE